MIIDCSQSRPAKTVFNQIAALSCTLLFVFFFPPRDSFTSETQALVLQKNKTLNNIVFSINNAKEIDSDAVSTLVVYEAINYRRRVLTSLVAYSVGMPHSFRFIDSPHLSDHFIAISEFTGGASCCIYTHVFSTSPSFSVIISGEQGVSFPAKGIVRISRNRPGVDHAKYANCCRPQRIYTYQLTEDGLQLIGESGD